MVWFSVRKVATRQGGPQVSQHEVNAGPYDQANWFWDIRAQAQIWSITSIFLVSFKERFLLCVHNQRGRTRSLPTSCYANSAPASPTALLSADTQAEKRGLFLRYTWSGNERATVSGQFPAGRRRMLKFNWFVRGPLFERPVLGGPLFFLRVLLIHSYFLIKWEGLTVWKVVVKQKDHVSCIFCPWQNLRICHTAGLALFSDSLAFEVITCRLIPVCKFSLPWNFSFVL